MRKKKKYRVKGTNRVSSHKKVQKLFLTLHRTSDLITHALSKPVKVGTTANRNRLARKQQKTINELDRIFRKVGK